VWGDWQAGVVPLGVPGCGRVYEQREIGRGGAIYCGWGKRHLEIGWMRTGMRERRPESKGNELGSMECEGLVDALGKGGAGISVGVDISGFV
jgi:hypothetical protein